MTDQKSAILDETFGLQLKEFTVHRSQAYDAGWAVWLSFTIMWRGHSRPRLLSTLSFEIIDASQKVDEEKLSHYKPSRCLNDILDSHYQVLSKLGYGSCSTVWLSRNIIERKYVALKVCISNYPSIERERAGYAHLRGVLKTDTATMGSSFVRSSLAEFELEGAEGWHRCFVFEPLTIDLVATRAAIHFDEAMFKHVAFYVFRALDFLHTKAIQRLPWTRAVPGTDRSLRNNNHLTVADV